MESEQIINVNKVKTRVLSKKWGRQKRTVFVLSILVIFFLSFIYDPPIDLDRYENYSIGESIYGLSFENVVISRFANGYDFIFYVGLRYFSSSMFWMQFFMAAITSLYYIVIFKPFNSTNWKLTSNDVLILIGLVSFPSILYVVNISRSIFSLFFFAIGVNCWLQNKYLYHIIFFGLSFFTHAGSIIFIVLFYVGVLAYILLKNKPSITGILCLILPPSFYYLFRILFQDALLSHSLANLLFETKYEQYLDSTGFASLKISIGALLSIYGEIVLSYILINIDKRVTFNKVLCLVFTTLTASLLTVNQNLLNRFILALPVFYTLYFFELYNEYKLSIKQHKVKLEWMTISSIISFLLFSLIIYQERKCFFPFIFN